MKKIILAVAVALTAMLAMPAGPALADTSSKNCSVFHHNNDTQRVQFCVAINHSDAGYVNNVHVDFDDHLAGDVYYLRNLNTSLYWYSNDLTSHTLVEEQFQGDFPIYNAETDIWMHHGCMAQSRLLIGIATFRIEWSPGDWSDYKSVDSEFDRAAVCL